MDGQRIEVVFPKEVVNAPIEPAKSESSDSGLENTESGLPEVKGQSQSKPHGKSKTG